MNKDEVFALCISVGILFLLIVSYIADGKRDEIFWAYPGRGTKRIEKDRWCRYRKHHLLAIVFWILFCFVGILSLMNSKSCREVPCDLCNEESSCLPDKKTLITDDSINR